MWLNINFTLNIKLSSVSVSYIDNIGSTLYEVLLRIGTETVYARKMVVTRYFTRFPY